MPLSQSFDQQSDILLHARNLTLTFRVARFGRQSWREIISAPGKYLSGINEIIEVPAIQDVSLIVKRGDRIGVIGPNGSGKTTLCRCLSGIYKAQSGEMKCYGQTVPLFRSIGLSEPELTGKENAYLLSLLLCGNKKIAKEIAGESIEFSELDQFAEVPVKFYSDGMRARLLISIVTSVQADILILDEALSSADHGFAEKLAKRIEQVLSAAGAVIFVSHSEAELKQYCSSLIVYDAGQIVFQGGVEEGIDYYRQIVT